MKRKDVDVARTIFYSIIEPISKVFQQNKTGLKWTSGIRALDVKSAATSSHAIH